MRGAHRWVVAVALLAGSCVDDEVTNVSGGSTSDDGTTAEPADSSGGPVATSTSPGSDGSTGAEAECGNAVVEGDEQCDDGNLQNGDDCYADCTLPYELSWQSAISGGDGADGFSDVVLDGAGNIYAVGAITSAAGDTDIQLAQFAPDGTPGWTYTHAGVGGGDDRGTSVTLVDGDLVIGGWADDTALGVVARVAAADGTEVWLGETTVPDHVSSLATDGTNIIVGGVNQTVMSTLRYVAKLDPAGDVIWENTDGGGIPTLTTDGDGNVHMLAGGAYVRLDPDGVEIYSEDLTWDTVALTVGADGRIAVVGAYNTFRCKGYCGEIRVYDPDFVEQWTTRYDAFGGYEVFNAARFAANGDVIVVGEVGDANDAPLDIFAGRFDEDGNPRWTYRFDGAAALEDRGLGMALDAAETLVVVGHEFTSRTDASAWIAALTQGTPP